MAHTSTHKELRHRFTILFVLLAIASGVLVVRLFALTVVQGQTLARAAEERLDVESLLATWRGSLLDRKGRVLAQDIASYDAAVSYPLAKGIWPHERARAAAKNSAGTAWRSLTSAARDARIAAELPKWQDNEGQLRELLAQRAGISATELQERFNAIAARVDAQAEAVFRRQLEARRAVGQSLDVAPEPIREMREMHELFKNLSNDTAAELRKLSDRYPGAIDVIDGSRRGQPWESAEVEVSRAHLPRPIRTAVPLVMTIDGALDQLVGSTRAETWKVDLERRPFERITDDGRTEIDLGGYRAGRDTVGGRGFERQFEDRLRGLRGQSIRRLDSQVVERIDPVPGKDVTVTIDAQLQVRVQAALDVRCGLTAVQPWHTHSEALSLGDALPAAAVIVDVATGEVLAAASTPLPGAAPHGGRAAIGIESASINRALEAAYPPGSLVKPLVYLAAIAEGVAAEGERIECNGHYFKDRTDAARCWIYRDRYKFATHTAITGGPLGVEEAMARSCNIFYYTLAERLGAQKLCAWYRRFGLGTLGGSVPTSEAAARIDARHDAFSTVSLGIGQGSITVTPLELANAYAMVARGGVVRPPSFLVGEGTTAENFPFAPTAVARVLAGLRAVVTESYGTGHHMDYGDGSRDPIIDAPGVMVWAKTGTAEAPPLKIDRDGDGVIERTVTDADHAWCAALVAKQGESQPRYAITVLVEHGGGGGRTAGPLMGAVISALVTEGYFK